MFVAPAVSALTTPAFVTVATAVFEEAHVYVKGPVPVAFEFKVVDDPAQIALVPVIAPATGTSLIVTAPETLLVTAGGQFPLTTT